MRLLIIDNYDSFTYNIVHACRTLGVEPDVVRNDRLVIDDVGKYDKIIISPGPGIPSEAGCVPAVITRYASTKPILGICLGHQAIGEIFGAKLRNLEEVYHGVSSDAMAVADEYLFDGLQTPFKVGRYHSWVVDREDFPSTLRITAVSPDGEIMALRHRTLDVHGVQFHPESILTPDGLKIIYNFLNH